MSILKKIKERLKKIIITQFCQDIGDLKERCLWMGVNPSEEDVRKYFYEYGKTIMIYNKLLNVLEDEV